MKAPALLVALALMACQPHADTPDVGCIASVRADLDDPNSMEIPRLDEITRQRDGDDLTLSFPFRAKNRLGGMQKMTGYCGYDPDGKMLYARSS